MLHLECPTQWRHSAISLATWDIGLAFRKTFNGSTSASSSLTFPKALLIVINSWLNLTFHSKRSYALKTSLYRISGDFASVKYQVSRIQGRKSLLLTYLQHARHNNLTDPTRRCREQCRNLTLTECAKRDIWDRRYAHSTIRRREDWRSEYFRPSCTRNIYTWQARDDLLVNVRAWKCANAVVIGCKLDDL